MATDKYTAVWVSNSSINDFQACPRLYYLRNVYKDPNTTHKINLINPSLALGQTVHEVLEALSFLPIEERFRMSLIDKYNQAWKKVTGNLGGFRDPHEELAVKDRGLEMIRRVIDNPGIFLKKAIKINRHDPNYLPNYVLSESENIILCGKIDWLEYLEADDSVHIVDFKTGRHDEKAGSLQLLIYCLLVTNCQQKKVGKASYWYLDRENEPVEVTLPSLEESFSKVLDMAKMVKAARTNRHFACPKNGCYNCGPYEEIIKGNAKLVGIGSYGADIYILQ